MIIILFLTLNFKNNKLKFIIRNYLIIINNHILLINKYDQKIKRKFHNL